MNEKVKKQVECLNYKLHPYVKVTFTSIITKGCSDNIETQDPCPLCKILAELISVPNIEKAIELFHDSLLGTVYPPNNEPMIPYYKVSPDKFNEALAILYSGEQVLKKE